MKFRAAGASSLLLGLLACSDSDVEERLVQSVQVVKNNAIEYVASTKRLADGRFVVHLHKNLYHKSTLIGVDTLRDTLPDLGMEMTRTGEDGEQLETPKPVPVQYDILFKVDSLR